MNKIIMTFLLMLPLFGFSQDYDQISSAFSQGNASVLGKMFDAKVEYTSDGKEQSLGRGDAENKLRSFFMSHTPRNFSVVHKGVSQNDLHYLIGELATSSGSYRATVYLHKSGENYLIQSLELEAD
ncbi:MAG: DUF4783 domain-containing protein [Flavobacteriales bacterium]